MMVCMVLKWIYYIGMIHLCKRQSFLGWSINCVVWLLSGGRKFIIVPMRNFKSGWLTLWDMLKGPPSMGSKVHVQQLPFLEKVSFHNSFVDVVKRNVKTNDA